MAEPAAIPVSLVVPSGTSVEAATAEVSLALDALRERLAIPGRVAVTPQSSDLESRQLVVNGWRLPTSHLAEVPVSIDPEVSKNYRWGSWATTLGCQWPGTLVTEDGASEMWSRLAPESLRPSWFATLMRATVSLGVPVSAIAEIPVLDPNDPSDPAGDVRVMAERVAAGRDRWLRLVGAPATVRHVISMTEPDRSGGRLDHALRADLDSLGAVMPALTYACDPTMPEGTLAIRLGELTILTCAVPPPGTAFMWSRGAWDEPVRGYRGPAHAALKEGLWAWVDVGSPAEQALGGARDDYLRYVTETALVACTEWLPDLEASETLLGALFTHIGAGHTVLFARELLTGEQLLVALRSMLRDGAAITQFGAFLRELLVELDLTASDSGFTAALSSALGRWRMTEASSDGRVLTQVRLPADLIEELDVAAHGWDECLPAEGGVDRLRDEIQALPTDQALLVVPDRLRPFVDAALRRRAGGPTVLSERDAGAALFGANSSHGTISPPGGGDTCR